MKSIIHKKDLEHLAELSRIELKKENENKILKDLEEVLEYFEELKTVNTENIKPMNGGSDLTDILREDKESGEKNEEQKRSSEKLKESFPEKEEDYLKVPQVFE